MIFAQISVSWEVFSYDKIIKIAYMPTQKYCK